MLHIISYCRIGQNVCAKLYSVVQIMEEIINIPEHTSSKNLG